MVFLSCIRWRFLTMERKRSLAMLDGNNKMKVREDSKQVVHADNRSHASRRRLATLCMAFVLSAQLILGCWLAINKAGLFQDESYTFMLANETWLHSIPDQGVVYQNGEPWRSWVSVDDFLGVDLEKIYLNQAEDNHPPLYYILFSLAYSLIPGATSPIIGVMLNVSFSLVGTILLYILCRTLGVEWKLAVAICAIWAVNAGMANCTVYLRMYCLLSVSFVAASLAVAYHIKTERSSLRLVLSTFLITAAGFLTQYFFVLFAFPLYLLAGVYLLKKKRLSCACKFAVATFGGIAAAMLAFPPSLNHLFASFRGREAIERAVTGDSFLSFLFQDWKLLDDGVFGGTLRIIIVLVLIGLIIPWSRKLLSSHRGARMSSPKMAATVQGEEGILWLGINLLLTSSVIFVTLVARVAPYASIRYLMSVNPILLMTVLLYLFRVVAIVVQTAIGRQTAVVIIGTLITILGWSHGIKYLDQENNSVAMLYSENDAMVAVSQDMVLQESLIPDALSYGTSVYFYDESVFMEFDFEELGRAISLYFQPGIDQNVYLDILDSRYPDLTYEYVGETIDHYAVYDVALTD